VSAPGAGILLALSGDDADILRALSQAGSGLCVVRRCADLPELLSAGMAGLASFALLDTGFDEIDRTVLDRLARAGLRGLLLVESREEERWRSAGWPVLRRDAAPGRICSVMQDLVRRGAADAGVSGSGPAVGAGPTPTASSTASGSDWLSAATPASPDPGSVARETAWLEELWRHSPDSDAEGRSPEPGNHGGDPGALADRGRRMGPAPAASGIAETSPPDGARQARGAGQGRIVLVWGPHGAPGRSTVAASLAHGLADSGGAILVDADVEAPSLVQLLGMPEDSSALAGAARLATHGRLDAESFQRVLAPVSGGLKLLGGLGRAGRWRELPPASMTEVWLQCRRAAAWTVVDVAGGVIDDGIDDFTLEPGRGAVTADLVSHADVVMVVGGADPVGVRRLLQLLDEVGSSVTPAGRVEVVVNRVRSSAAGPAPQQALREALARFGGLEDIVLLPDDPAAADSCLLQGRSVLEGAPASALGKALSALVDRIDPQAAAARKTRSSRRSLLQRRRRDGRRDSTGKVKEASGKRRKVASSKGGRRRGRGEGQGAGGRVPATRAPHDATHAPQRSYQSLPPSIQPVGQPWMQPSPPAPPPPPGPAHVSGTTSWPGTGAAADPGVVRGPEQGVDVSRAPGRDGGRGSGAHPPASPGTGRHRY